MKRIHPVFWGLICGLVAAIISWFTFAGSGVMHELPLSPGLQILYCIHYPEVLANRGLAHLMQPHSQAGHWTIAATAHFSCWLTIGALSGFVYAWLMGKHSDQGR
jgi:hypothetical protein